MSIVVKVAKSPEELKDVYQLRYRVYKGEGSFEGNSSGLICDHFDAIPGSCCVIAYADGVAIGTMRVTCDSNIGLPADVHYDFAPYRSKVMIQARRDGLREPLFINAGMLAIDENWRGRRDVFKAIFKIGCDVAKSWGCTHIICTVNEGTTTIYRRLGFEILDERFFFAAANEYVVPVGSNLQNVYDWTQAQIEDDCGLVKAFSGLFEYLMVSAGEKIFAQGDRGDTAYLINQGVVKITHSQFGEEDLHLASLGPGELFGEMSLIDGLDRSASAVAVGNCELLVLNHQLFWEKAEQDPNNMRSILRLLSARVRNVGTLAHLYAYGTLQQRFEYFVNKVRQNASPSVREEDCVVAKMTLEELAQLACATLEQTEKYMQLLVDEKMADVRAKTIKFYGMGKLSELKVLL